MAELKRLLVLTRDRANAAFRQRIEPYLEPLAERGIATEVAVLAKSPWKRRGQWRRAGDFDGVLLHRKTLTLWDGWGLAARRLVYDFDDAVMYKARAPDRPHLTRLRRFERTVGLADLILAGSPILADLARTSGGRQVERVPTGLDLQRFPAKEDAKSAGPLRLVWIGSRSTLKQLRSLRPVLEAVGRDVPGAVLRIIADAGLALENLKVENIPWSYEAEGRLLAESDIGIAPLPDTPYTRGKCGFKILQYMAAGLPVVASPVGVNADYVQPNVTGLHATTAAEWTAAVERLAGNATLREQMGRAGRQRIEKEFDFRAITPRVCRLIASALA